MLSFDPNKTWAVLIGTSQYVKPNSNLLPLPTVKNNLRELERLLADREIIGLPSDHIRFVLDKSSGDEIMTELEVAISEAQDTLIIYYAGHGVVGAHNKLFLATTQTIQGSPEGSCALDFTRLQDLINEEAKQAKKIIFILDCCFSGRAIGQFQHRGTKQVFILASSFDTEPSKAPGVKYTAFTGELISLLTSGIAYQDRDTLTLQDIDEYLDCQLGAKGFPKTKSANYVRAGNLKFARNLAVQKTSGESSTPEENRKCHLDLETDFPKSNCEKVVSTCRKQLFSKDKQQGDTAIFLLQDCLPMCGRMCVTEIENGLWAKAKEVRRYSVAFDLGCQPNQMELLNRLAGHVGLPKNLPPDPKDCAKLILERIGHSLQKSHIVLFDFGNFHYLPSPAEFLTWLVQDFWSVVESELAKIAQREHYYVKFICVISTDTKIKLNQTRIVNLPLHKWTVLNIQDWLDRYATLSTGSDTVRIADQIYKTTQKGTPQLVYQRLQELDK